MKIVLVRHFDTDWNHQGRLQGQTDISLNDIGRARAEMFVWQLAPLGIGRIVSSDMSRARETAEIFGRRLGIPVLLDNRLRECSFGKLEGMTVQEIEAKYGAGASAFTPREYDFTKFGGESRDSVLSRHRAVISDEARRFFLYHRNGPRNVLLFIGHGNGLNTLLFHLGQEPNLKRGEYKMVELPGTPER
ncbi:histidine phosphatase family protein [Candidatus Uhrbacteria bacterium]|nr:histidine phosphatase family protein [Candidatus Uhrbacteria bacterium]